MVKQVKLITRAYGISFFVTITGTLLSVLFTTTLAYPMSRKDFKFSKILTFLVFFTMLFNGGVVPSYMMWSQFFHLKNTIWALILPNYLITAFNIMLVKNYYQNSIPDALIEAAEIDGASELTIFWKIVFPLSTPVIATISLFTALKYWNDWVNALYYITKPQLYGITEFTMRFVPGTCEMKFCQQGKEHEVLIATDGSWRWNRLKLDGRVNSELCLSGYWEDKNCFVVHARWIETCYENELKFCFEKDQVHMSRMNKVGRYMTSQPLTATAQKA